MRKPKRMVLDNGIYKIPFKAETTPIKDLHRMALWSMRAWEWKMDQIRKKKNLKKG